jgi:hypothetical protein
LLDRTCGERPRASSIVARRSDQPVAPKEYIIGQQSDHLHTKRQAEQLAADAKAVEAVIRMFDAEFNARTVAARRRVTGNPWFKRGTLFRAALDVLRTATAWQRRHDLPNDKRHRDFSSTPVSGNIQSLG